MMTIGSLFSGIGGLELGLEWAGLGPVVWQCEIDPFCRAVLAKHWPTVTRFEDVTRPRDYPAVDLICGGFPCQDVSDAGARRGLGGERSSLWWHFARVIERVKPKAVVVENVAGAEVRRWLPAVRRQLCDLGYRSRPFLLSAADVGAPHLRRRIFILAAHLDRKGQPAFPVDAEVAGAPSPADAPGIASRSSEGPEGAEGAADAHEARREGPGTGAHEGWGGPAEDPWRAPVSGLVPVVHGLPGGLVGRGRRSRIRALGNAVVPQQAQAIGRMIVAMASPDQGTAGGGT